MFSWGPRGEPKLWIYAACDWMRARTRGTDVEQGEVGWWWRWLVVVGLGFSGTEGELVSDRRGSLSDKWRDSPWPEGAAGPARLPRTLAFTLRNGSWHHNCIISPLHSTQMDRALHLNPRRQSSPRWVTLINWFADTPGHYLFKNWISAGVMDVMQRV